MSGKAESGLDAAETRLFVQNPYVITPVEATIPTAMEKAVAIAKSLQSTLYFCTPEEHDRAVAWISHLPAMVSNTLISACLDEPDSQIKTLAQSLASSGFRDTSRVGGGNPELGLMMAKFNRQEVLQTLKSYRHALDHTIELIDAENWPDLTDQLLTTQQNRPKYL